MLSNLRAAVTMLGLLTLLTGVAYPLLVTGIAQAVFPSQANGSLIADGGGGSGARGSALIGQPFDAPRYFFSRPSATTPAYNAAASSGSNLGPTNPALREAVARRVAALRALDPDNHAPVPVDLVTASASGLDPHISPAAALYQVGRVARARGLSEQVVRALVDKHSRGRQLGLFGEPSVAVLPLNLELDRTR